MSEYDTSKFKATLNFLAMRTCFGTFNELPMTKAYQELMNAINDGRAIRLYRYYKPTDRNITDIEKQRIHLSTPLQFDDAYDCQPIFDIARIRKIMEERLTARGYIDAYIRRQNGIPPNKTIPVLPTACGLLRNFEKNKKHVQ